MARQSGPFKVKKNLYLSNDLCEKIDIILTPSGESSPSHGAWSGLVESLLRQHWKNLPVEAQSAIEKRIERNSILTQQKILGGLIET